jgi:UDP-N-acetylglucosamine pyrophosphorylase
MTYTFMTSAYFRNDIVIFFISHDIYIYDSSVFQTWQQHLWHQCFSDITAILNKKNDDVISEICWCHKCVYHIWSIPKIIGPERNVNLICSWSLCTHITSTFMTSVYFSHDIYIHDISVFQTFQQHLWHQCYSDMTSTFMTSVVFSLDMTYTFIS